MVQSGEMAAYISIPAKGKSSKFDVELRDNNIFKLFFPRSTTHRSSPYTYPYNLFVKMVQYYTIAGQKLGSHVVSHARD